MLIQSSSSGSFKKDLLSQVEIRCTSDSSVKLSLVASLGSLNFGLCSLAEDVQLIKESDSGGNWLWELRHIVWDSYSRDKLF